MEAQKAKKTREDRIINLLQLARKAGRLSLGSHASERSLKQGQAYLILLAGDAGDSLRRRFLHLAEARKVRLLLFATKDKIGMGLNIPDTGVLTVNDRGFSSGIEKYGNSLEVHSTRGDRSDGAVT